MEPLVLTPESRLREILTEAVADLLPSPTPKEEAGLDPKEWLTQKECLRYTGVSVPTLARWRSDGLLSYSKIGGLVFYRLADVKALLERNMVNAPGELAEAA